MIYLYPANKMENLLALVEKIQQISPLPIFSKEVFIVQNAGMQHWLNMSLAERRGISLNVDYALPAQFLWGLIRSLVNKGEEVEQAPFSREAMCWRIYQLLVDNRVLEDNDFLSVTQYWCADSDIYNNKAKDKVADTQLSSQENLKRYQLACQLADLFEQYLVFRPDWIDAWQAGKLSQNTAGEVESSNKEDNFTSLEKWQAKLWLLLVEHQDYNPVQLLEQAKNNVEKFAYLIPKRLCFFGINAMAPMWLSFINALSDVTDVHFFHLNPCVDYWGDILSEKQAIKNSAKWTENHQQINDSVGNPLLANLGQQGREFLVLLQQYSMVNIEAFESTTHQNTTQLPTALSQIQDDILTLTDARNTPIKLNDDSIVITSAHSALREVQGLHDWLLHQFNDDSTLTPKDVLVMCPQVEMYAPYVNAVFARGWQELDSDIPPLPCSISDRVAKDSEPLVSAFSDLLTLPDSRFQVSQILAWLRLPAMQTKFGLEIEEIDKCTLWVEHACIHWGLNVEHKQRILNTEQVSEQFTWQYGLSRLLQGFAFSDQEAIYQGKLVLPNVEGNDGILLGQLMLVIEQLQYFTQQLNVARTPQNWHQFLLSLIDDLFDSRHEDGFKSVFSAIESFVEYCQHASFTEKVELPILREYLNAHFSQPDPGRQFMVGQVTFCSMLPMRSIPFKIVAVLGLNDGEYPRQRAPLGFDLMSISPSRIGDRSRRGDDRYLFLEAIISARHALYLSYQGRSIKNNNQRQPSIVLKELMDYLEQAYDW
ncbi:MAG: exodeoxyribonuclease V subunit gamma, partial [Thalassotalea sp.]|nr:exodeoxyribonuclease V subunit gamma [Thalassotalea sp.]